MADFCRDCSIVMFGKDFKELALPEGDKHRGTLKPGEGWVALCEACGPVLVDDEGKCLDHTDVQHHVIWHGKD